MYPAELIADLTATLNNLTLMLKDIPEDERRRIHRAIVGYADGTIRDAYYNHKNLRRGCSY